MIDRLAFCECLSGSERPWRALSNFTEEIGRLLWDPDLGKASDACFALGRFAGSIVGRQYIRIPGDTRCLAKLRRRMLDHGCTSDPCRCPRR